MLLPLITLLATLAPAQSEVLDLTQLLTPLEYKYTGGGYKNQLFRYRLYVPKSANAGNPLPLVVWLHGLSQTGSANVAQMKGLDKLIFRGGAEQDYPFFLLAVQCPSDNRYWSPCTDKKKQDDMVNVLFAILQQTLQDYPIDRDAVSMTGLSSGGNGCWEFGVRYPTHLAALAPHAAGRSSSKLELLEAVPVWAFHSINDEGAPIAVPRTMVRALQKAGGTAYLTEVDAANAKTSYYVGHDCWTTAFHDYQLLDWMLAQRRGQASWLHRPGSVSLAGHFRYYFKGWSAWQVGLQALIPALAVGAVWTLIRRRRAAS